MKTDLDHLPPQKQREIERVVQLIFEEFEDAFALAKHEWKKAGRILKVILYGSYARGTWVDEPHTAKGYQSDYDLLIIVNDKRLADRVKYWAKLDDRLMREYGVTGTLKTPVNFIVHTLQEVNDGLAHGRYFFMDVVKDGILLYDADDVAFPKPRPKTPADKLALAQEYFAEWYSNAGEFFDDFLANLNVNRLPKAAFELHQCVEHLYNCSLLTLTFYAPHNHNIKALRGMVDKLDRRFTYVWPQDYHWQRAAFNILRDAYVKARYARRGYKITAEQLRWLGEIAQELSEVVRIVCDERIAALKAETGRVSEPIEETNA